jgi:flagellum-specific peptidoglycan hydrolase FlgJ
MYDYDASTQGSGNITSQENFSDSQDDGVSGKGGDGQDQLNAIGSEIANLSKKPEFASLNDGVPATSPDAFLKTGSIAATDSPGSADGENSGPAPTNGPDDGSSRGGSGTAGSDSAESKGNKLDGSNAGGGTSNTPSDRSSGYQTDDGIIGKDEKGNPIWQVTYHIHGSVDGNKPYATTIIPGSGGQATGEGSTANAPDGGQPQSSFGTSGPLGSRNEAPGAASTPQGGDGGMQSPPGTNGTPGAGDASGGEELSTQLAKSTQTLIDQNDKNIDQNLEDLTKYLRDHPGDSQVEKAPSAGTQHPHTISSTSSSGILTNNGKDYFLIQRDANGLGIYQNIDIITPGSYKLTQPSTTQPKAAPGSWSQIGRLSAGLKIGTRGAQVAELQTLLGLEADGVYGPKTEQALKASFVAATYASAKASEAVTRIPAAITAAQAILESNYGKSIPTDVNTGKYSYNIFGVKAGPGQDYVTSWTHEVIHGQSQSVLANFAAYDSFEESLDAHSAFLIKNRRYQSLFDSNDPVAWAHGLQEKGYATDPLYAAKLINIINQWNLK